MNKGMLIQKLRIPLLALGVLLVATAYIPLIRRAVGKDAEFALAFSTTLLLLIAGFMAALAGVISLYRERANDAVSYQNSANSNSQYALPHVLGLTLFIPIPFLNVLSLYTAWIIQRKQSQALDQEYRKSLNFQISVQLYWLLILFLMPIGIGFLLLFILILVHLFGTLYVLFKRLNGSAVDYPATIKLVPIEQIPSEQH